MLDFLKDVWAVLTFQGYRSMPDLLDIVLVLMFWVVVIAVLALIGMVAVWVSYTIYRLIAYDYEEKTYTAKVTKKEYEPEHTGRRYNPATKIYQSVTYPAEYHVHFVTSNGLGDYVDDEDLYDWAKKGSKFRVTMKIGRSRADDRAIKYWRTLSYSWR